MPISNIEKEFVTYVVDLMQSIGPVQARYMFGGHGIFLDNLMFGLIVNATLYLKVDNETRDEFVDKGLQPFTYIKKGKEYTMSYYQAPEETLEDSEEMTLWTNKAFSAALRAASDKVNKD